MLKLNVKESGAMGNGVINDTVAIQKSIDEVTKSGGEVVIPKGIYLCGTIKLKSNVSMVLEKGAVILGCGSLEYYSENEASFVDAVNQKRGRCLILAHKAENIAIKGDGVVCGRGGMFKKDQPRNGERPFLVRVVGCKNVLIEGVELREAAAWCLHLLDSDYVTVKDIKIDNHVNVNNDGIDIDACRNVKITGCYINSADDALCLKTTKKSICENIEISDCVVTTHWSSLKIGTESAGDFKNIVIRDCYFYDVAGCGIKIVPVDGGNVENVLIENVRMHNCTGPIFIANGDRLRKYFEEGCSEPGTVRNVEIRNVEADVIAATGKNNNGLDTAKGCIVISGTPSKAVEDIYIHDCFFSLPGGVDKSNSEIQVPEMEKRYPEFGNFGMLPSYGYYLRHGRRINIENNEITLKQPDQRQKIVQKDLQESNIDA